MESKDLPKCDCGIEVGLSFHGGRHWCPKCLWSEIVRLHAIVEAAWLVRTEEKDKTPCPDYSLRATYRVRLNKLIDAWKAAQAKGGK